MTIIMFVIFVLVIYFALRNFFGTLRLILMKEWVIALVSLIMTILWTVIAVLVWVKSLKERLLGNE